MAAIKTDTVTFRIPPETKVAVPQPAGQEHRSLANMLVVMFRDWGKARGAEADEADQCAFTTLGPSAAGD